MKIKKFKRKIYVSLEKILDFEPNKPETYTESPLLNDVLIAISEVGLNSTTKIARHLGLPNAKLWAAVEIITGYDQLTFRRNLMEIKIDRLYQEHPELSSDMIAHELGYCNRSALYNAFGKGDFDELISNKHKIHRYYKDRKEGEGDEDEE